MQRYLYFIILNTTLHNENGYNQILFITEYRDSQTKNKIAKIYFRVILTIYIYIYMGTEFQ